MTDALVEFEDLMEQAELAAARFDNDAITVTMNALESWTQSLVRAEVPPDAMVMIRERVAQYRGLVAFLAKNLGDALTSATEPPTDAVGYRNRGGRATTRSKALLTRTYG